MRKMVLLGLAVALLLFGNVGLSNAQNNPTEIETFLQDAESDYQTCMNYCMNDGHNHGFEYCQANCKGLATQLTPSGGTEE